MSGGQMTDIDLSLLVGGLTFLVVGFWYLQANRRWIALLSADDPRLANDAIRDPVGWAFGGGYRVRTWLSRLRVPDEKPEVEYWRVRTVNRFVVAISLSTVSLLAGGALARYIAISAQALFDRYDTGFAALSGVVLALMFLFYTGQLGRTLHDFGNGRRPTWIELAVALGGIAMTLVAMAVMPNLDLSKP
jgi:hypothetical protein